MGQLTGRVAIVTGGGRGIGRAEALALAAEGAAVVVNDLGVSVRGADPSQTPADDVVAEITSMGGRAVANHSDISNFEAARLLVHQAIDEFGALDILVNNAGGLRLGLITETSEADWDHIIAVHLKGTFNTCRHAVPVMLEKGRGRIINTSSSHWRNPQGQAGYAAAKAGIVGLTWDLAWEVQDADITVNAIAPLAQTRMFDEVGGSKYITGTNAEIFGGAPEVAQRSDEIERVGPEWVSPMVVYLASDHARDVNGCVFRVGNGKIAIYSHPTEARAIYYDPAAQEPFTQEALQRLLPASVLSGPTRAPHLKEMKTRA